LTPIDFSHADSDGLTILAIFEEYMDFAFITLTRDELGLELEDRKCHKDSIKSSLIRSPYRTISGITKSFTSVACVSALKLSFLVTGIPQEEHVQGGDQIFAGGKFEL